MMWESNFEPGVYIGLDIGQYHADPAISSTDIKELLRSPFEYWTNNWMNPQKVEKKTTQAMKFGSAYHELILEPDKFNYEIIEGQKTTSKVGCLAQDEYSRMQVMRDMIHNNKYHIGLLRDGYAEVSVFWNEPNTGLPCKCRFDYWRPYFVTDLKTTTDVSDGALRNHIPNMGYDVSAAMYMNGMAALRDMVKVGRGNIDPKIDQTFLGKFIENPVRFVFLLQETESPFISRAKAMTPGVVECGLDKFYRAIQIAKVNYEAHGTNKWPTGYEMVEDLHIEDLSQSINYRWKNDPRNN